MKSRISPIKWICAVTGACALLAAAPFADAARPNTTAGYDKYAVEAGTSDDVIRLADDIVIERKPTIRVIRPEPKIRVRVESPGRYEDQKVLVRPGHFEEYRVWVPERYDPDLNATFHGHYETRQRWIPDAYEYRKVWVPGRF